MYSPHNNGRLDAWCVRGNVHVSLLKILTIVVHFCQLAALIVSTIIKKAPAFTDAFDEIQMLFDTISIVPFSSSD